MKSIINGYYLFALELGAGSTGGVSDDNISSTEDKEEEEEEEEEIEESTIQDKHKVWRIGNIWNQ